MLHGEIRISRINHPRLFKVLGLTLIILGLLHPLFFQNTWFNIIIKIREAINSGDSGHLILASASVSFLYSVQSTLFFMGTVLIISQSELNYRWESFDIFLLSIIIIIFLYWSDTLLFKIPWEPISTILSLIITLILSYKLLLETNSFFQVFIVSIQVFFAFHWLNIMPVFTSYRFGQSDISYSIKITGTYLHAVTVLNFVGFAFFLPFIISAFITATLFISNSRNIYMMRENFEKESELKNMRAKALENRIYQEVKSLVHDLKTPLVTIRGLNSLLLSAKEHEKLKEYSDRIENSVTKMNEMISSFLYESSRQKLQVAELMSYIRAQLPLEDENIKFVISIDNDVPHIYVNKIRIARAVINILENAIIVPCKKSYKLISIKVKNAQRGIHIIVQDNGIGIKETNIHLIWEVGYSTNNTSGFGLPFAKRIIEDNEGTIEVQSQVDVGTKVIIFLPSIENFKESII